MEKTMAIQLEELREQIAKDVEKVLLHKDLWKDDELLDLIRGKKKIDEELLLAQNTIKMLQQSAKVHKDEAIMILALIEAFKIRSDEWPESLIDNTLKSIDVTVWAIGSHLQECYIGPIREKSVQENLDSIEELINED